MPAAPLSNYLILAALLFFVGAAGVVVRRNALIVFMSVEIMLNAVNLTIVAFSRYRCEVECSAEGHAVALLVMALAAAEAVVGLAILLAYFRLKKTVHLDEATQLKR